MDLFTLGRKWSMGLIAATKILAGLILLLLLAGRSESSNNEAKSQDLGTLGKTYEISEVDILEVMMKKIQAEGVENLAKKMNKVMTENAQAYIKRPGGTSLPSAKEHRKLIYDPSITLGEDIKDLNGRILFRKGLKKNPMDYIRYETKLCFINGDDELQVAWMRKNCSQKFKNKVILVSGNPMELMGRFKTRIYFDQGGVLIEKFGIQAVPAIVTPGERVLNVEEIPVN